MKKITLNNGEETLVDDADYEAYGHLRWRAKVASDRLTYATNFYWCKEEKRTKARYLHRMISGAGSGECVDHINQNPLDNRRENLRVTNTARNLNNTRSYRTKGRSSRFKGVHWNGERQKWVASITNDRKTKQLGRFDSEEMAARAYDAAVISTRPKEFQVVNFGKDQ